MLSRAFSFLFSFSISLRRFALTELNYFLFHMHFILQLPVLFQCTIGGFSHSSSFNSHRLIRRFSFGLKSIAVLRGKCDVFRKLKSVFEKPPQINNAMRSRATGGLLLLACQIFGKRSKHEKKVLVLRNFANANLAFRDRALIFRRTHGRIL